MNESQEIHHPPPGMRPHERPDRDDHNWPDYRRDRHYPPFPHHLPRFQPGIPLPQPPGQQDWTDDLTWV